MKVTVLGGSGAWPVAGQGGQVLAYTGDTGPSPDIVTMARDEDVLLAEATFPEDMPAAQDARRAYPAGLDVAAPGLTVDLDG